MRNTILKDSDKIETKQGYKKTKIGWIPKDWDVFKYLDVCEFINGKSYKKSELLDNGKYKILRVGNLFTNENWYYTNDELSENKYVFENDLMYAWSASFGPHFWKGEKTVYHYHIWKIIVKQNFSKFFLFYALEYDVYRISSNKQGGTMFHITKGDMENRLLKVPIINEQKAIANCLSTWDDALVKLDQLIAAKQQLKKALMQQLLSGKKRLPGFNGEWEEKLFSDITERVKRKNTEVNDTVVTISAQRGFVLQEDFFNKRVASSTLLNYTLVHKGEFCYNKSYSNGYPMGAFKRLDDFEKAVVTTLYICFGLKDSVNSDFMLQYFEAGRMTPGLMRIAQEGGRAHGLLNISLPVKIPQLKEQTAIAEVLNTADQEIELLKTQRKQLQAQKKGLMQQLLTGKKRLK
ncbi:MAG: restriction endonuclease subunit S [Zunongwangia sp.]|uniref:restriction endonuclease subunit S n=1 Tax=Zunongwangia sp. TaxID=1965325 RepID=UPI003241CB72